MAFESRNGGKQQYFYLSCTKEGRSRKLYVGPAGAPLADVLDRFRRLRQAIQAAAQEAQNDYLQVQAQLQDLCDQVHLAEAATYLTRGYRRTARGTWTLRGGPNMTGINYPSYTPLPTQDEYEDLVQAAQHGDPEALGELRAVLLRHPQIWQSIGDLAGQVEAYRPTGSTPSGPGATAARALRRPSKPARKAAGRPDPDNLLGLPALPGRGGTIRNVPKRGTFLGSSPEGSAETPPGRRDELGAPADDVTSPRG
jgi:hypothetical protein